MWRGARALSSTICCETVETGPAAQYIAHWKAAVPLIETNTRKIIARLLRDGWSSVGGGKHDKYEHPGKPDVTIIVPRHREQSPGVARSIAKLARWI
ncbi:MAG: addiction module toxin, HicA family [Mesorhizobium sp.]|nr:type II toxin-antitoxin system HicA family toxin [Mesorhizobium sp. M1A.F.Ca.IN.022.06.1.1]RUV22977.1 type II toxin-antitoxin system HicA family toxin [Mesorhizobium sp. M1A.F.Ca.IN.022.04.1.1]RUV55481.1 type II toxin-antitoxin system HicA family toxin [Mesorhizobium sp. M1A.F.Ca.IN.022.02.1.1]RUV70554.1 type II toxin-antitoxin system HicA family toxin [Mesorhizobium sp. M1A.F.Ca.IN.020.30.1.1]RWG22269.1 MAG: type II toxin-antitoxin system HicA family toxin [Mesorhizobium sp.]TGQ14839.1 typ